MHRDVEVKCAELHFCFVSSYSQATAVREIVQDKKSVEEVLTSMQKGLQERD